jgi:hypothetical protein
MDVENIVTETGVRCRLTQVTETMDLFESAAQVITVEIDVYDFEMACGVIRELDAFEPSNSSKSGRAQCERYSMRFKEFLRERKLCDQIEKLVPQTLNSFLRQFYCSLRGKDGQWLSPSPLGCVRAGIQRYLTGPPVNRTINIIDGKDFMSANRMLKTIGAMYLKNGGKTKSYAAIEPEDMKKIVAYMDRSTPLKLQEEVIFKIIYYFGERGREPLRPCWS